MMKNHSWINSIALCVCVMMYQVFVLFQEKLNIEQIIVIYITLKRGAHDVFVRTKIGQLVVKE